MRMSLTPHGAALGAITPPELDAAPAVGFGAGLIDARTLRGAIEEARDEERPDAPAILSERAAWRLLLGAGLRARRSVPYPPRVCYQRAPLSRAHADRATLRAVEGEGAAVTVRVDVIVRDRDGANGGLPLQWAEYATERRTPAGEGLGLVASSRARPRGVSGRDTIWTRHDDAGWILAVVEGGPDTLEESALAEAVTAPRMAA